MKFTKFDLYHQDYSQKFFQKHFLQAGVRRTELVSAEVPRPGFAHSWFGAVPVPPPEPKESRVVLRQHIGDTVHLRSPEQILQAAKNVARFNQAYATLAPLAHPALQRPKPEMDAARQLAFELRTIELDYERVRESHRVDVESWSILGDKSHFAPYQKRITAVLAEQVPRIEEKYRHVSLIARAALKAADMAQVLVESRTEGDKLFTPEQRDALRSLHREVKRSLAVAKSDLESLHGMYARAQAATLKFAPIDARDPVERRLLPIRLDNLLGPGQVVAEGTATAGELRSVVRNFLTKIGTLSDSTLRERIRELSTAQTVLLRTLRSAQPSFYQRFETIKF